MKKLYMSAVLFAMAMTACTENEAPLTEQNKGIETLTARIIQPTDAESRIIVGDKNEKGSYPLTWRADDPTTPGVNEADVIYVYDTKGNAARFVYYEEKGAEGQAATGIFKRDTQKGTPIEDVKQALCVPSSTGLASQLPSSINASFNYMSTMMYKKGAENAPMYGTMEDGILTFRIVTGMLELNIPRIADFRALSKNTKGEPSDACAVKVSAFKLDEYGEESVPAIIAASQASLINTETPEKANIKLGTSGEKSFIGIFVQKGVNLGTKLYCPLITGEYAKLTIDIWDGTGFKTRLSNRLVIKPKGEAKTFTIGKKLYSFNLDQLVPPIHDQNADVIGYLENGDISSWEKTEEATPVK